MAVALGVDGDDYEYAELPEPISEAQAMDGTAAAPSVGTQSP